MRHLLISIITILLALIMDVLIEKLFVIIFSYQLYCIVGRLMYVFSCIEAQLLDVADSIECLDINTFYMFTKTKYVMYLSGVCTLYLCIRFLNTFWHSYKYIINR